MAERLQTLGAEAERERAKAVEEGQRQRDSEWSDRLAKEQQRQSRDAAELQHRTAELSASLQLQQRRVLALEKEKLSLLSAVEEERQRLREVEDSLQVAQAKADQAGQLEAKVQRLTGLVSSVGDLQAQAEYSEEEARKSVERIVALEREVKEVATLKAALTRMKEAVIRKEEEGLELKLREERMQAELDEARDAVRERERRVREAEEETRRLREELKEAKSGEAANGLVGFDIIGRSPTASLRERVQRLEAENAQLRSRRPRTGGEAADSASTAPSSPTYTESEVEAVRSIAKSVETKYLEAMRKVAQLERAARQVGRPALSAAQEAEEVERLHAQVEELQSQLLQATLPSASTAAASSDAAVRKLRKYGELWKAASKKLAAHRAREEEGKRDAAALREQIAKLKDVIGDREREVEVRERVRVEELAVSLRERRLMQSAFYNLGTEWANATIMSLSKRGGTVGASERPAGARAWLAQQRAKALE